jgi:MFS family permease
MTALTLRQAFVEATVRRPALRSCSQAGFVNNLNDALAWGVVPLFLALHGASLKQIGLVAGIYPAVWGIGQIGTGHLSDVVGRKPLIVAGMFTQALALAILGTSNGNIAVSSGSAVLLGIGTALVYPTLIAAISDNVSPFDRAPVVGTYRFWRDMGYVAGAVLAGVSADALGYPQAIGLVAVVTALSGVWFLLDFPAVAPNKPAQDLDRTVTGVP